MDTKNIELLIIPDVHSRSFWRDAVDDVLKNTDKKIVFLGDYLDPYPFDNIPEGKEMDAFLDIVMLKRQFPDRIVLLLGNHDLTYALSANICECRTLYENFDAIKGVFNANKDNFTLGYETTINNKHFVLTHGGLTKLWVEKVKNFFPWFDGSVDSLNRFYKEADKGQLIELLGMVSWARGGYGHTASVVWASAFDDTNPETTFGDSIQIVGHTQLKKPIKDGDGLYFIDARKPIIIDVEGNVLCYDGEEIKDIALFKK